jgi:hypothetical protein
MIDQSARQLLALTRSVNRIQSAQALSFTNELSYTTLTYSENQEVFGNSWLFLSWGYSLINSDRDNGIEIPISWQDGTPFIFVNRQGFYNANITLSFDKDITKSIMRLYVNDVIVQTVQQLGGTVNSNGSNSFSFTFFVDEGDIVQFAFSSDEYTQIINIPSDLSFAGSPILNLVKIV